MVKIIYKPCIFPGLTFTRSRTRPFKIPDNYCLWLNAAVSLWRDSDAGRLKPHPKNKLCIKTIFAVMINYSIVMRPVNANLFEINQAKSRVKAALANGQAPAQEDLDLVATEKQNAYAMAQYSDVMSIEKFARHISSHGCVYSRADISAILYLAVDCMREQLLEGKKIRLGDFSVSLSSKGAESADRFSAQNITGVNVVWDCGKEFRNLINDAEFNLVASRSAQTAVLKAIREGGNASGGPAEY